MKTAYVCFYRGEFDGYDGKEYAYMTDIDFSEGDFAVVKVESSYKVVKVVGMSDEQDDRATKYIVDKVDVAAYEKRMADEARRQALMKKMERRVEEIRKFKIFDLVAKTDESMKALLDEYKSIG